MTMTIQAAHDNLVRAKVCYDRGGVNHHWVCPAKWDYDKVLETCDAVESYLIAGKFTDIMDQAFCCKFREQLIARSEELRNQGAHAATMQCSSCKDMQRQLASIERTLTKFVANSSETFDMKEENCQLREKLARMMERCQQQEKYSEILSTENTRLRGELSDLMSKVFAGLAQSTGDGRRAWQSAPHQPDCEENVSDAIDGSWVFPRNQGCAFFAMDASSDDAISWISVGTQHPHCFMSDSIFKTMSGQSTFFLPAHELQKGSIVVADDGQTLLEVAAVPETHETDKVIELQAGDATLSVTRDHRIPVAKKEQAGKRSEVQASELKQGDIVFVNGHPAELASIREIKFSQKVGVIKIVFKPDLPVGVFSCPPMISSKGGKKKPLRRSGMSKRGQTDTELNARISIPDTAPGEYRD